MDNKWGIHHKQRLPHSIHGPFKKMSITPIWKAKAESKCKIFAWILLHRKILTADNLERRGWPHDPLCKLCNSAPETPAHLCKDCPYTSAVWTHVVRWLDLQQLPPSTSTSTVYWWWKKCRKVFSKEQKPAFDGLLMYFGGISGRSAIDEFFNKSRKKL